MDRQMLWRLLGRTAGPQSTATGVVVGERHTADAVVQDIELAVGGERIRGSMVIPQPASSCPGVLYCHAHGNRYDVGCSELVEGIPYLQSPPYATSLAERGIAAFCVDMPCFGERASLVEDDVSKQRLWAGETLFGQMISELTGALTYLCSRAEVDEQRIATLGISMGGTHAYWLGALDDRVGAVAQLCTFASLRRLVEQGSHGLHGHYMTVPGLLHATDTPEIAAMVSPRPQLICIGADDRLTPPEAFQPAAVTIRSAYASDGASQRLEMFVAEGSGHAETPEMRAKVVEFLCSSLGCHPSHRFRPKLTSAG